MPGSIQHPFYNDILGTPPAEVVRMAESTAGRRACGVARPALFALGIGLGALLFLFLAGGARGRREADR